GLALRPAGRLERALPGRRDDGIQLGADPLEPIEENLGEFDGRYLARADERRELAQRAEDWAVTHPSARNGANGGIGASALSRRTARSARAVCSTVSMAFLTSSSCAASRRAPQRPPPRADSGATPARPPRSTP